MSLDLPSLFTDVFHPSPGEKIAVVVDVPTEKNADHPEWTERRQMAAVWLEAFRSMGHPTFELLQYPATGSAGSEIPSSLTTVAGELLATEDVLLSANILIAMTQFSATGPLTNATRRIPTLRVASMPGVNRAMEKTALAVDHPRLRQRVKMLTGLLNEATSARVKFDTGHEMTFDLRHRGRATADAGECFADSALRLINLPTGEAFIVPYEGELPGDPSLTAGLIPVKSHHGKPSSEGSLVVFMVEAGEITEVGGDSREAQLWNEFFASDPARRHVAEFGLGCNDKAVVSGRVLEDEKAGFHWAFGRNEYFNDGHQGADKFLKPENVVHMDVVYAAMSPVTIASLDLTVGGEENVELIRSGIYNIW